MSKKEPCMHDNFVQTIGSVNSNGASYWVMICRNCRQEESYCIDDLRTRLSISQRDRDNYKDISALREDKLDKAKSDLKTAVEYLREGKREFTPNTTNSLVDGFLERFKDD